MKSIKTILIVAFIIGGMGIRAELPRINYQVETGTVLSGGKQAPFWLQNNQFGKMGIHNTEGWLLAGFEKAQDSITKPFQYTFKLNTVLSSAPGSKIRLHEYFFKGKLYCFDFCVGAREEHIGNQDSTLSSGGLIYSSNIAPIPKISIGVDRFTSIPLTGRFVEFKGMLSHGWMLDNTYVSNVLFHHKFLHLRFGGQLPVHLQVGLDHFAQWGGNHPLYGQQPHAFKDFIDIFMGKSGGSDATRNDQLNALGNHILSQSLKLEASVCNVKLEAYWQNISEDGPFKFIWKTMNKPDGLWGISLRNSQFPVVRKILFEYLNTTDQSGLYHDKDGIVYGGADNYFNNGIYLSGWTYYSRTIGTPLITSPIYNDKGEFYITNNRIQAYHFGAEGDVQGVQYRILATFSKNYGTYSQKLPSNECRSDLWAVELRKKIPVLSGIECGLSLGWDHGGYYGNSAGCLFTLRKSGQLFR